MTLLAFQKSQTADSTWPRVLSKKYERISGFTFSFIYMVNPENDQKQKVLTRQSMDSLKKDIKDEHKDPINRNNERSPKSIPTNNKASMDEVDLKFQEHVFYDNDNGVYRCSICDMEMQRKHDMRRHLETHLIGLSFDCSACGKTYRSSN